LKSIGVVSVGRTDWSIWRPVLKEIQNDPTLELRLYATGTHLSPEFGMTVNDVIEEGFVVSERVEMLLSSDSPQGVAKAIGLGTMGFGQVFARSQPDILLVMGDRYETLAAVTAAMPFKIPVAHLHGGESGEGAIDELIRHAITKMSHIHFASTQAHAQRIVGMGEELWRVHVTGAPGIDAIKATTPLSRYDFAQTYGIDPDQPFLLVTYHPVTLEIEDTTCQVASLLKAIDQVNLPTIFTYPNADVSSRTVMTMVSDFERCRERVKFLVNMGPLGYVSAMGHASVMVGNSSSGIIESASFQLPVVNIGNRQRGRFKPRNVIDVGYSVDEIVAGIQTGLSPGFKDGLQGLENPYGAGKASRKIVRVLRETQINQELIMKTSSGGNFGA